MIIVFSDYLMAGLPLYYFTDYRTPEDTPYYRYTREEFDAVYNELRLETEQALGKPLISGECTSKYQPGSFGYALWPGTYSFLALLQHVEGDANYGHEATIDFRILP